MIDRTKITLPDLKIIRIDKIEDTAFLLNELKKRRPKLRRNTTHGLNDEDSCDTPRTFTLNLARDVRLSGYTAEGIDRVRHLEFTPATLLWGHNACPVSNSRAWVASLQELVALVAPFLVHPEQSRRLIPGLDSEASPAGRAKWSKMELFVQSEDQNRFLLDGCMSITTKRIRKKAVYPSDDSICLAGSYMKLQVYDKTQEIKKKFRKSKTVSSEGLKETWERRITRIEFAVSDLTKLRDLDPENGGLHWSNEDLVSFKLPGICKVISGLLGEVRGFTDFGAKMDGIIASGTVKSALAVSLTMGSFRNIDKLLRIINHAVPACTRTQRTRKKELTRALEHMCTFRLIDFFPEDDIWRPDFIRLKSLEYPTYDERFRAKTEDRSYASVTNQLIEQVYGSDDPLPEFPQTRLDDVDDMPPF